MSAIAQAWVSSIKVGNQTAKQLLQFYASHNFNRPGFEFKNETLAEQLEVTPRAVRNAHKLLIEKGFIKKEVRHSKTGRQLTNRFSINIPREFEENFKRISHVKRGGGTRFLPRGEVRSSLNNNINSKKHNRDNVKNTIKKSKAYLDKKEHVTYSYPKNRAKPKQKQFSSSTGFACPTKQSTSYDPNRLRAGTNGTKMSPLLVEHMNKMNKSYSNVPIKMLNDIH